MKLIQVTGFNLTPTLTAYGTMSGVFNFISNGELKPARSTFRAPKLNSAHEETPYDFLMNANSGTFLSFSYQYSHHSLPDAII